MRADSQPRRLRPLCAALLSCALAAGCALPAEVGQAGPPWKTQLAADGEVVWLTLAASEQDAADLPVQLRVTSDALVCHRVLDGEAIHFLTFERRGDDAAYGVYGLWREKNSIPVDFPLRGEPIAWGDRDQTEALGVHLATAGVHGDRAGQFVSAEAATLFGEGLRVFFTLPGPPEARFLPDGADERVRVFLIQIEVGGAAAAGPTQK